MNDGEKLVLVLLLRDGATSTWDMGLRLGYRPERHGRIRESAYEATRRLLNKLVTRGAARHHYGSWAITEPGRAQAALLMAKDPALARLHAHEQP